MTHQNYVSAIQLLNTTNNVVQKHPFPGLSQEIFPRLRPQNTPHSWKKNEKSRAAPSCIRGRGLGHRNARAQFLSQSAPEFVSVMIIVDVQLHLEMYTLGAGSRIFI